ncbi:ABC transporter permease subunit [Marinovum sp. 2_MG-2023]|uniref:amino acid ABC transporter permease n=1 Tax=unclassified Marinovum TaxID=2647166 RepID=UPI0026E438F0|nr:MULTISPECIES: ABC transporter permease subunit [unclassified Marinovum]MDO6729217.1 ABC transporter permease subunit [Marinovum sp. 2_MG-2023]MDO6779156.1 ABC transporter permease subunit [Marinovum sp. 1_MG-2023]
MSAILKNKRVRNNGYQLAFVGSILLMIVVFVTTARTNLEAQGLTSGFDFLHQSTGWRISFSLIDYSTSSPYWKAILVGVLNSLFLGAIALPVATVLGITVGVMRTSGNGMAELIGTTFVEIFRNIPLILQLLFWYTLLLTLPSPREAAQLFGGVVFTGRGIYVPGLNVTGGSVCVSALIVLCTCGAALFLRSKRWSQIDGSQAVRERRMLTAVAGVAAVAALWLGRIPETSLISIPVQKGLNYQQGIRISPELMACVIAISIYGAGYIAEITRAGFNAIPKGQSEAGHALGLTGWQIFSRLRLPLALRIVMPTLINQFVWLFKATTIGIAISFTDFFMVVSTAINQSGQTLELIGILMGGFLIINYAIAWVLNRVNDAIKLKGTQLRI